MGLKYSLIIYVQILLVKDALSQFNSIGKTCGCINMPVTFDVPINSIRLPNGVPLANNGLSTGRLSFANNGLTFTNPSLYANSGVGLANKRLPARNGCPCGNHLQVPNLRINDNVLRNLPINNALTNAVPITNVPIVNNVPVGSIPVARNLPIANNGIPVFNNMLPINNGLHFSNLPSDMPVPGNVQLNCQNGLVGNLANLANLPAVNAGQQALANNGRMTVPLVSMNSLAKLPTVNGMPVVKITETVYKVGPTSCQNSVVSRGCY